MIKKNVILFLSILLFSLIFGNVKILKINKYDPDWIQANLSRIWIIPPKTEMILENYPFSLLDSPITIAEGFEAYDGNLLDTPGDRHWGIDYVRKEDESFLTFPIFSTHEGIAFKGDSKSWGKFVVIRKITKDNKGYNTLYSHLDNVPDYIPYMNKGISDSDGIFIENNIYLGEASTTGNTKGIPQLHFEFHIIDTKNNNTLRADPYGVYKRLSSNLYPQPGLTLENVNHYWMKNQPDFANNK